jgi:hypothetical protein
MSGVPGRRGGCLWFSCGCCCGGEIVGIGVVVGAVSRRCDGRGSGAARKSWTKSGGCGHKAWERGEGEDGDRRGLTGKRDGNESRCTVCGISFDLTRRRRRKRRGSENRSKGTRERTREQKTRRQTTSSLDRTRCAVPELQSQVQPMSTENGTSVTIEEENKHREKTAEQSERNKPIFPEVASRTRMSSTGPTGFRRRAIK